MKKETQPTREELIKMYEDKIATIQKQYEELAERFNNMSRGHAALNDAYNQLYKDFQELKRAFKTTMKYYD